MNEAPSCEYMHIHLDIVSAVLKDMPNDDTLYKLSELYKLFGDKTRIKISILTSQKYIDKYIITYRGRFVTTA